MKIFWITAANLPSREAMCPPREALRAAHPLPCQMMGRQNLNLCSDSSSRPFILRTILLRTDWSPGFSPNIGFFVLGKQCSCIKALLVCIYQYSSTCLSASYFISESGVLSFVQGNDRKNWLRLWRQLSLEQVGTACCCQSWAQVWRGALSEWRLLHYIPL